MSDFIVKESYSRIQTAQFCRRRLASPYRTNAAVKGKGEGDAEAEA